MAALDVSDGDKDSSVSGDAQYRLMIADDHPLFRGALREAVTGLPERVVSDEAGSFDDVVALLEQGAEKVYACATHAVLSGPAVERIANSRLEELIVTNTIPLREDALRVPKIKVLSIAGLLGRAIESIHMETSVSTLFN